MPPRAEVDYSFLIGAYLCGVYIYLYIYGFTSLTFHFSFAKILLSLINLCF